MSAQRRILDFAPQLDRISKSGYKYRLPPLTDLQIAALACVRDDIVTFQYQRVGYERYTRYFAEEHDITCQTQALRKRRLIYFRSDRTKLFRLSPFGITELAKHPEY